MRPVVAHLTINGQPFCDWTGCVAHSQTARKADVFVCEFTAFGAAMADAQKLADAGVRGVAVAMGDCPNAPDVHGGSRTSASPDLVCWEHQDGAESIRLSYSVKVF